MKGLKIVSLFCLTFDIVWKLGLFGMLCCLCCLCDIHLLFYLFFIVNNSIPDYSIP